MVTGSTAVEGSRPPHTSILRRRAGNEHRRVTMSHTRDRSRSSLLGTRCRSRCQMCSNHSALLPRLAHRTHTCSHLWPSRQCVHAWRSEVFRTRRLNSKCWRADHMPTDRWNIPESQTVRRIQAFCHSRGPRLHCGLPTLVRLLLAPTRSRGAPRLELASRSFRLSGNRTCFRKRIAPPGLEELGCVTDMPSLVFSPPSAKSTFSPAVTAFDGKARGLCRLSRTPPVQSKEIYHLVRLLSHFSFPFLLTCKTSMTGWTGRLHPKAFAFRARKAPNTLGI